MEGVLEREARVKRGLHFIWLAPFEQDEKNRQIIPCLRTIADRGGQIEEISEGALLAGIVQLPFLEVPDGMRYFGVESISRYAQNYFPN